MCTHHDRKGERSEGQPTWQRPEIFEDRSQNLYPMSPSAAVKQLTLSLEVMGMGQLMHHNDRCGTEHDAIILLSLVPLTKQLDETTRNTTTNST